MTNQIYTCANFCYLTGNTKVISQDRLQQFQSEMTKVMNDPYQVVMKKTRLPISLLNERKKVIMRNCKLFKVVTSLITYGRFGWRILPILNCEWRFQAGTNSWLFFTLDLRKYCHEWQWFGVSGNTFLVKRIFEQCSRFENN